MLNKAQQRIEARIPAMRDFILDYWNEHRQAPTRKEIAEHFGCNAATVQHTLNIMKHREIVYFNVNYPNSLRIVGRKLRTV